MKTAIWCSVYAVLGFAGGMCYTASNLKPYGWTTYVNDNGYQGHMLSAPFLRYGSFCMATADNLYGTIKVMCKDE